MNWDWIGANWKQWKGIAMHPWSRLPLHAQALLLLKGRAYQGTLMDVSLGGAWFAPEIELGEVDGNACCVSVHQIDGNPVTSLNGIVIHNHEHMLGIKFKGIGDKEYKALSHVFEVNHGDPDLLDRDFAGLLSAVPAKVLSHIHAGARL